MLKAFFEIGARNELFDRLKIGTEKELCVSRCSFEATVSALRSMVGNEAEIFSFLATSERLSDKEKKTYAA